MTGASLATLVAIAGGVGATSRYVLDSLVQRALRSVMPVGTLVVNVVGSFILGLLGGLVAHHGVPDAYRAVVGVGFCGGLTTFSTASFETVRLVRERLTVASVAVGFGGVLASMIAAAIGLGLALA